MAQDGSDGLSDVGRGKHGERDLVEQRLKGVMIAAIDYRDVDRQMREPFGGVKAGKACADDDNAGMVSRRRGAGGCGFGLMLSCRFGRRFGRRFAHGTPFRRGFGFHASYVRMRERTRRWQRMIAE
jgi:hypothetical protein